jgi:hypothetical protein
MSNPVCLDPSKHQQLRVLAHSNFKHAANNQVAALTADEFGGAASSYPVVLIKDQQSGQFRSVALLGLKPNQNLFYSQSDWHGIYMPSSVLREPFMLGPDPNKDKTLTVYLDEDSVYVSKEQGEPLFDSQGETGFLKGVQRNLADNFQNEIATQTLINELIKHGLVQELSIQIKDQQNATSGLKGLYSISETALRELPKDVQYEWHEKNYFLPIHAMLISLNQFKRLIKLNNATGNTHISGMQISVVQEND